jgi:hypothetical protein
MPVGVTKRHYRRNAAVGRGCVLFTMSKIRRGSAAVLYHEQIKEECPKACPCWDFGVIEMANTIITLQYGVSDTVFAKFRHAGASMSGLRGPTYG